MRRWPHILSVHLCNFYTSTTQKTSVNVINCCSNSASRICCPWCLLHHLSALSERKCYVVAHTTGGPLLINTHLLWRLTTITTYHINVLLQTQVEWAALMAVQYISKVYMHENYWANQKEEKSVKSGISPSETIKNFFLKQPFKKRISPLKSVTRLTITT